MTFAENPENLENTGYRFFLFLFPVLDSLHHVTVAFLCRKPTVALLDQQFIEIQAPVSMIKHFIHFIVLSLHWFLIFDAAKVRGLK
jgi:hypothetical protein